MQTITLDEIIGHIQECERRERMALIELSKAQGEAAAWRSMAQRLSVPETIAAPPANVPAIEPNGHAPAVV